MTENKISLHPVFVVGYGHSGTTLLLNTIGRHSSFFSSHGETKFFDNLWIIKKTFPDLEKEGVLRGYISFVINIINHGYKIDKFGISQQKDTQVPPDFMNDILLAANHNRDHCEIFRIVFEYLTQKAGKLRWLEKTPAHIFHIDKIIQYIPTAKFIEIIRDPRDILASKKTRRENIWGTDRYKPEERQKKHLAKGYDPFWDTLSWKSAIGAGRNAQEKYQDNIFSVQYEHLVSDPETYVKKICDFLNIEFDSEMLNVSSGNPADSTRERNVKNFGINNKSVGRWKLLLTPSETALIQYLAKSEMNSFDYQKAPIRFYHTPTVIPVLIKSLADLFMRFYRKFKLGGG